LRHLQGLLLAGCVLSIGLSNPVGAAEYALTVQAGNCGGSTAGPFTNPSVGVSVFDFAPGDCGVFQQWNVTAGSVSLDRLNPSVTLIEPLTSNATIEAQCTTPQLTVLDCSGNLAATYNCPQPGVTKISAEMPAGREFQSWVITAGGVNIDMLNNPTFLIDPMVVDATIEAQCLALVKLTVVNGTITTPERQPGGYYLPGQVVEIVANAPRREAPSPAGLPTS